MKKIAFLLMTFFLLVITSCSKKDERQKWEYMTYQVFNTPLGDFTQRAWAYDEVADSLNALGQEGWEVVESYTRVETVHPNFGNEKYVTGLQPNTRTSNITIILKRPYRENDKTEEKQVEEIEEMPDTINIIEGDSVFTAVKAK